MSVINKMIQGNQYFKKYQRQQFDKELSESIINGQRPEVLLISCCDSRVTTDIMFENKPGDLFVLRNIGNFVPRYDSSTDFYSVAAAIEYGVDILKVSHIIVCGHSYCGACESLYHNVSHEHSSIKKWLEIAQPVKEYILNNQTLYSSKEEMYRLTEKHSITFQLDNLMTYPSIKKAVLDNQLKLYGWYYDLEDGSLYQYCESKKSFEIMDGTL